MESWTISTFKGSGDRKDTRKRAKRKWPDRRKGKRVRDVRENEAKAGVQEKCGWEVGEEPAVGHEPAA